MIRINKDTPVEVLENIRIGDLVTDGFSKTSFVSAIKVVDDGLYRVFEFHLDTDRVIATRR